MVLNDWGPTDLPFHVAQPGALFAIAQRDREAAPPTGAADPQYIASSQAQQGVVEHMGSVSVSMLLCDMGRDEH
jgi:hypothetical protein